MSDNQKQSEDHRIWAAIFIGLGLFIIAASVNLIRVDESSFHAPRWVVFLAGAVSALSGLMLIVGENSRVRHLLAAVLLLSMGATATWVSLFGSTEGFSGGIPLLSREANAAIARVLAGFGAVLSFGLSAYVFRRAIRYDA